METTELLKECARLATENKELKTALFELQELVRTLKDKTERLEKEVEDYKNQSHWEVMDGTLYLK